MVGNPWTFPLIWLWTYSLGHWLLGGGQGLTLQPEDFSFEHIFENPLDVLLPMIVGSIPSAVVVWLVIYRSEEHTSELQSLMRNSYAVFCLKKKKNKTYILI